MLHFCGNAAALMQRNSCFYVSDACVLRCSRFGVVAACAQQNREKARLKMSDDGVACVQNQLKMSDDGVACVQNQLKMCDDGAACVQQTKDLECRHAAFYVKLKVEGLLLVSQPGNVHKLCPHQWFDMRPLSTYHRSHRQRLLDLKCHIFPGP